jgi:hypothetical protein
MISNTDIMNILNLDRTKILSILKREEEIRFSDEYIHKCNKVADTPNAWLDVTAEMQKDLVAEFGYIDTISNTLAIHIIRIAYTIYPDEEIKNSVVQFRENIACIGKFIEGDTIINPMLYDINGKSIELNNILNSEPLEKTNIIFSGSHT